MSTLTTNVIMCIYNCASKLTVMAWRYSNVDILAGSGNWNIQTKFVNTISKCTHKPHSLKHTHTHELLYTKSIIENYFNIIDCGWFIVITYVSG